MALNALSKVAPQWYTPDDEKGDDQPARFRLRPLTPPQLEEVFEIDASGNINIPLEHYGRVLRNGLVDWENVNDPETGKPFKCTAFNHARLPSPLRMELAGEIIAASQITEDDKKN